MSKKKKKKKFKKHHFVHHIQMLQAQGIDQVPKEKNAITTVVKQDTQSTWEPPAYIRKDLKRITIWTISLVVLLIILFLLFSYTDLFKPILEWIKV